MENLQEVINLGNEKVLQDTVRELEDIIEQRKQNGKSFCSKSRRKSLLTILSEKLKDIECIDLSIRFKEDK